MDYKNSEFPFFHYILSSGRQLDKMMISKLFNVSKYFTMEIPTTKKSFDKILEMSAKMQE